MDIPFVPAKYFKKGGNLPPTRVVLPLTLLTPFHYHVGDIVASGPEEEMVGTDTQGRIAVVEDHLPWWDGADRDFPGDAVGEEGSAFVAHPPVTTRVGLVGPEPASARPLDFGLPSFLQRALGRLQIGRLTKPLAFVVGSAEPPSFGRSIASLEGARWT